MKQIQVTADQHIILHLFGNTLDDQWREGPLDVYNLNGLQTDAAELLFKLIATALRKLDPDAVCTATSITAQLTLGIPGEEITGHATIALVDA